MNFIEKKERNTLYHSLLGRISFSLDENRSLRLRRLHANEYTNKCDRTEGQKQNLWNKKYDWEKFACKYIDACVCVLQKTKFISSEEKDAIKWNTSIFSQLNPLAIILGIFVGEQCDDDTRVLAFKRNEDDDDDNETTVIRKYLITFCSLSSLQIIRHICEIFGHFECAKILLSNGFYLHQMKDTKIDFTTDSSRRRIKDGTFIWRTPFVLLIIAKTMQTNK